MELGKTKQPLINVYRMFVTYCCSFQEIVSIFLCLRLGNVLLDVFIKTDCFMQIYCFLIIEINIIENLLQLCFLLLTQLGKCFLLRNQSAT